MLEVGWSEILVVAIVAILVVGPKELPGMLRTFGRAMTRLRAMANDFRGQFEEALKEADLDDVRKGLNTASKLNPVNALREAIDPLRQVGQDIKNDLQKASNFEQPAVAPVAPAAVTPAVPAEPAAAAVAAPAVAAAAAAPVAAAQVAAPAVVPAPVETVADAKPAKAKATKPKADKPQAEKPKADKPKVAAKAKVADVVAEKPVAAKAAKPVAAKAAKPVAAASDVAKPAARAPRKTAAKAKTGDA